MAYIPPHKRNSLGNPSPALPPKQHVTHFRSTPSGRSSASNVGKFVYADRAITNWYAVESGCDGRWPSHVHLEPVSVEAFERKHGRKPLILVNKNCPEDNTAGTPWANVAELVLQNLPSSFVILKNEIVNDGLEQMKPTLVARFGSILFHQKRSAGTAVDGPLEEAELRQQKKTFYNNITSSYMQNTVDEVVPNIGLHFESEKETYRVQLSDKTRPDSTLSCKCKLTNDNSLLLYKVKLNHVRQMLYDFSCLDKDLDLRIMLSRKRTLICLSEDELNSIRDLISAAVLDSNVKGGLRWPIGTSSGNRFSVVSVWHYRAKTYKNQSFRLEVMHADRFDCRLGIGQVTREVDLQLKKVVSLLQEGNATDDTVAETLKDNIKMIWDNFLCCDEFLK